MATPARRRNTRRYTPRRSARARRNDVLIAMGVGVLFAVVGIARWMNEHRGITITAASILVIVGLLLLARMAARRVRAHKARWTVPTNLHAYMAASPDQFEQQTAALCKRDGCTRVRVVGGAGDLAADVLATTPGGKKILIQCKRYAAHNAVGSDHVQRVNGTYRDIHGCDQAAIVTTSGYTRDATALARRVNITLYGADELAAWARGGRPPWN